MQANNPFVVRFYYSFSSPEKLFLVMEYCPGGDLATLLQVVWQREWQHSTSFALFGSPWDLRSILVLHMVLDMWMLGCKHVFE